MNPILAVIVRSFPGGRVCVHVCIEVFASVLHHACVSDALMCVHVCMS